MSNIFASTDQKKKITFIAIYATIAVIVCLLAALLITQIVAKNKTPSTDPAGDDAGNIDANFVEETVTAKDLHSGNLILVNKDNEYIFDDNPAVVSFPTTGRPYGLRNGNLKVNPIALSAFNDMMKDAYKNITGCNIVVMTSYRSPEEQTALDNGTPAGYSDFHTGMSLELKEADTWAAINAATVAEKYQWIYDNAHKYGFIVRYPDDTEDKKFSNLTGVSDYGQVFRYVGVAHATYIKSNNLCLEEYLELLRTTYTYDNPLSIKGADGKSYQVYYAAADENSQIMVSSKYGYEISGDNMNGYIVTVNKAARSSVKTTASE